MTRRQGLYHQILAYFRHGGIACLDSRKLYKIAVSHYPRTKLFSRKLSKELLCLSTKFVKSDQKFAPVTYDFALYGFL